MRAISEGDLAVFISLLCSKIVEMKRELANLSTDDIDELSDEDMEEHYQLQESIEQYESILGGLRAEYEAGIVDGINLPSYEELTQRLTA